MPCAEEAAIAEVLARVAAGPRAMEMMSYQPQRGLPEHREAGAFWLSREGFEVSAEQLAVTAGAHPGVPVALAAMTRPAAHISSDSLPYPGVRRPPPIPCPRRPQQPRR